jgi:hypothetical protein
MIGKSAASVLVYRRFSVRGQTLRIVLRVVFLGRDYQDAQLSKWRSDHEKARDTWDYRWGRNIDCGAHLAAMVAKECGAIA